MTERWRFLLVAIALGIFLLDAFGFARDLPAIVPNPEAADFAAYFVAASILNQGQAENLYDAQFQRRTAQQAHIPTFGGNFNYLPLLAVAFRPLALLPFPTAASLWIAINLILLYASVSVLLRLARVNASVWLTTAAFALCLVLPPTSSTLVLGQANILLLFILSAAVRIIDRDRLNPMGGFLIGISSAIKLFPILLVIPLVLRREWRQVGATLLGVVSALLIGIVGGGGLANTIQYASTVFPRLTVAPLPTAQSLDSILGRLLTESTLRFSVFTADNEMVIDTRALIHAPQLAAPLTLIAALAIIAVTSWFLVRSPKREFPVSSDLSLVLAASLVVLPHIWDHYEILLLIPWACMYALAPNRQTMIVILVSAALLTIHRFWRPLLFLGLPVWLFAFGYLAAFITWAYMVSLSSKGMPEREPLEASTSSSSD